MMYNDDIIIGDFVDTYFDLPTKTMMIHKFVQTFCHHAKWIFIHDDDVFIRYKDQLKELEELHVHDLFQCMSGGLDESFPLRWGKYKVSAAEYPMGYKYPKFCHGPCMEKGFITR